MKKIPPLILKIEKIGLNPSSNGKNKYTIGYKIASKVKSEVRRFFIHNCYLTAKESRVFFYNTFEISWDNEWDIIW